MNLFGPQGAHAANILPGGATKVRYGSQDTWVRDCSAAGANDGTALDAAFFNILIGNLNQVITQSGALPTARTDFLALYKAINQIALNVFDSGEGIILENGKVTIAVGKGVLPLVTS
ncbi:hypothetical protein [Methylocystis hirsuta]|uniref:Uncharacterized protein n=1 Tax=Methylocystis hirsuta TaxID=369798 RepID=A0A3M9XMY1_9HYPH|nr:hypothetical protein [Methylocystis hirsuta]RNJ49351.1 hypothetical protein D1O30_06825 [Methylocystis hirsuta]